MSRSPNLEIRIDRLVVDGVNADPHQARRVHAAMEDELTVLFRKESLPGGVLGGSIPAVRAPGMQQAEGSAPADVGRAIARSVHALITGKP